MIPLGELNLKKLDERFRKTDSFLLEILKIRLANGGLSDLVVENKIRESGGKPFSKRRLDIEEKRIERMKRWAQENGINPNFAGSLMYSIIVESCMVQDEAWLKKVKNHEGALNENDSEVLYAFYRQDLLKLTAIVAESYDDNYGKGHMASEHYFKFEKKILNGMISEGMQDKSLAVDLGCATGIMSFEIAHRFKKVNGYDISPDIIAVANKRKEEKSISNVDFIKVDIEDGINLPENSVSLAVMNMGTASDVKDVKNILECLRRVLRPDGKFFLSFYNSESLLSKIGFIPWPMTLAAYIDADRRCLSVHYANDIYFLYARPRSVKEVENLLAGFEIDNIFTYPTLASLLPNVVTEHCDETGNRQPNEEVRKFIKKIDNELASSPLNCGTYIIATGGKIAK